MRTDRQTDLNTLLLMLHAETNESGTAQQFCSQFR